MLSACHAPQFHSNLRVSTSNAATRRKTMRVIALLICIASRAPPRLNAAHSRSACNCFALATGAIIDADRQRARRGAAPRYPWRTHTLRNHIFGNRFARASRSRCAATSQNERPSTRSALARNRSTVSTVPRAGANGHGYMTKPKSRQAEAFEANGWPNQVAERAAASFVHSIAAPPYSTAPPPCAIDAVP